MKRILVVISCFCWAVSFAQNDSVNLGVGAVNEVFYKLADGTKTTVDNTSWDLAFSCRPAQFPNNTLQSATIRINEANGLKLYRSPYTNTVFNTFDTTGFKNWPQVHDADTNWYMGAFNKNKNFNDVYNYGWGEYSLASHALVGDSMYLLQLPNGTFKKFTIIDLKYDTAFNVHYANLNNSNDIIQEIRKKPFKTKNFVYLNLSSNLLLDREPTRTNWDLLFTKYYSDSANDIIAQIGVLLNDGVVAYEANGAIAQQNCYNGTDFSKNLNSIGQNFKQYNTVSSSWELISNRAYFIKVASKDYKVTFSGFSSAANGYISFIKSQCAITSVNEIENSSLQILNLYPNPATDNLSVVLNNEKEGSCNLAVYDI